MEPKIVFFDCDGVLISSNTWENLMKLIKFPKKKNNLLWNQYYSGKLTFKEWVDIQSVYFRKNLIKKQYQEEIVEKVEINPEASEIVTYLKNKNIPIAIISSGEKDYVEAVANKLKIKIFKVNTYFRFDKVGKFTKMDFHNDNPISKVIQIKEICEQFNYLPEETFFVGDSDNDLLAFELTRHGLLYKNKDKRCLKAAWKTIENLNEIKDLIY